MCVPSSLTAIGRAGHFQAPSTRQHHPLDSGTESPQVIDANKHFNALRATDIILQNSSKSNSKNIFARIVRCTRLGVITVIRIIYICITYIHKLIRNVGGRRGASEYHQSLPANEQVRERVREYARSLIIAKT